MTRTNYTPIAEGSQATPGLWNAIFSALSADLDTLLSGATSTFSSDLSTTGAISLLGPLSVRSGPVRITVNSNVSDYIYFTDSSNAHSNYIIGSFNTQTADGLNIWDDSGQTMLVNFSKQSIRFFQSVVGPVFDIGGALASTYNAATFGGSTITKQIQAAISAASLASVARVYIPASMYPYDPTNISFDTRVQMVREGGSWDVWDVVAYGASGNAVIDDTIALQAAIDQVPVGNVVSAPPGSYKFSRITINRTMTFRGVGIVPYADYRTATNSPGVIFRSSATTGAAINLVPQVGAIRLSGVRLEGFDLIPFSGNGTGWNGIGLDTSVGTNVEGIFIDNVRVMGFGGTQIIATGGATGIINDVNCHRCTVENFGVGPAIDFRPALAAGGQCTLTRLLNSLVLSKSTGTFALQDVAYIADSLIVDNTSAGAHGIWNHTPQPLYVVNCEVEGSNASTGNIGIRYDGTEGCTVNARIFAWGIGVQIGDPGNPTGNADNVWIGPIAKSNTTNVHIVAGGSRANVVYFESTSGLSIQDGRGPTTREIIRISNTELYLGGRNVTHGIFRAAADSAITPGYGFSSETSLGFYRSAASTIVQSYGTLATSVYSSLAPGSGVQMRLTATSAVRTGTTGGNPTGSVVYFDVGSLQIRDGNGDHTTDGRLILSGAAGASTKPVLTFSSENSLGWYRSGNSTLALSYGTLDFTQSGAVTSIASLTVKSGANNSCGTAVLGSNGSVNVANTYVKTGDLIFLTDQTPGGTLGDLEMTGIRNSSGFTIASTSITDTSTVAWLIIRPG